MQDPSYARAYLAAANRSAIRARGHDRSNLPIPPNGADTTDTFTEIFRNKDPWLLMVKAHSPAAR
jgi:hypothetical protein